MLSVLTAILLACLNPIARLQPIPQYKVHVPAIYWQGHEQDLLYNDSYVLYGENSDITEVISCDGDDRIVSKQRDGLELVTSYVDGEFGIRANDLFYTFETDATPNLHVESICYGWKDGNLYFYEINGGEFYVGVDCESKLPVVLTMEDKRYHLCPLEYSIPEFFDYECVELSEEEGLKVLEVVEKTLYGDL